jgi:hypothetical protein
MARRKNVPQSNPYFVMLRVISQREKATAGDELLDQGEGIAWYDAMEAARPTSKARGMPSAEVDKALDRAQHWYDAATQYALGSPDADFRTLRQQARRLIRRLEKLGQMWEAKALPEAEAKLTKVEEAMQVYMRDPNQSNRKVAGIVGCSPSLLSNDPRYRRLREAYQGDQPPKGSKSKKDRKLEAKKER